MTTPFAQLKAALLDSYTVYELKIADSGKKDSCRIDYIASDLSDFRGRKVCTITLRAGACLDFLDDVSMDGLILEEGVEISNDLIPYLLSARKLQKVFDFRGLTIERQAEIQNSVTDFRNKQPAGCIDDVTVVPHNVPKNAYVTFPSEQLLNGLALLQEMVAPLDKTISLNVDIDFTKAPASSREIFLEKMAQLDNRGFFAIVFNGSLC